MRTLILALLIGIFLAGETFGQQTLDIDITQVHIDQFPTVRLHLQVRRQGAVPVKLSELSSFVSENGVPQTIESLACPDDGSIRLSIAVLLDRSRSMARYPDRPNDVDPDSTKLRDAKKAIRIFLGLLTPRDEAAIFSFSTDLSPFNIHDFRVDQNFTTDIDSLQGALVPIGTLGGTRIWQAVIDAVRLLQVRSGRKALILVTDGKNSLGNNYRTQAVNDAVNAGIPVYSIGIGADVDVAELTALSSSTGGRFFNSPNSDGLEKVFEAIADELITDECVLKYQSSYPCSDGSRRIVDVQVNGNALLAEDDTSYVLPDRRETITLTPDLPVSAPSRNTLRVPILPDMILSTVTPVTYSMKVTYDNTLMRWTRIDTDGSISQGLPVTVSEAIPGILSIDMPGGVPALSAGALFVLEFDLLPRADERRSVIGITDASFTSVCPNLVAMQSDELTILPCEESYSIGGDSTLVVAGGEVFGIPLRIDPLPAQGDRMTYHGTLRYDSSLLRYEGITLAGGILDGSALVRGGNGTIDLTIDGIVKNTNPIFATLRFTGIADKKPRYGGVSFETKDFTAFCKITSDWSPTTVLVDGICEPLVRRKVTGQISNHPNPAAGSTTITFKVPVDGNTRLRLLDSYGREVRMLLQAWMPVGEYSHNFDVADLPAGEYLGVLETGQGSLTRKIIIVR